jgi:hypothetical protein
MKRISDKQINKYKSPLIFAATFVAIGLATLAFSSAATNSASIETESSAIAAPACTVNDVAASNGKALKFGGTGCAQIGNPLNIPRMLLGMCLMMKQTESMMQAGTLLILITLVAQISAADRMIPAGGNIRAAHIPKLYS